jgi:hypothetical protein
MRVQIDAALKVHSKHVWEFQCPLFPPENCAPTTLSSPFHWLCHDIAQKTRVDAPHLEV